MPAASPVDPVALTADLIRCPSVTPADAGAMGVLDTLLSEAGFECHRVDRGGIANLFARWGRKGANRSFGFNGHTDVVPAGDIAAWSRDPFGAEIADGWLWGRGATDMKSAVAAFAAAAIDFVRETPPDGAVILAITGDEEGDALDGTRALLDWMAHEGEAMSVCLVGEPTCPARLGDAMKIGRRGSLTAQVTARGVQGHSAYPHRAKNPLTALVRLLDRLAGTTLDSGTDHFDPSTLAIVTIDTGNPATNVIPARARATVNIRFNDSHTGDGPCRLAARGGRAGLCGVRRGLRLADIDLGRKLPDATRPADGSCRPGGCGGDGDHAGPVDGGRNLGRPLCEGPLPGRGIRSGRKDHAPGGRTGGGGPDHRPEGDLSPHPRRVFPVIPSIAVTRDLDTCLALRRRVFIEEQGVSEAEDVDELDGVALHLLAMLDATPVGTARLLLDGATGKIGRVCVVPEARGTGLGAALIRAAVAELRGMPGVARAKLGRRSMPLGSTNGWGSRRWARSIWMQVSRTGTW